MAIEPIKGLYVHDEVTDTDGVAKYDYDALVNAPDLDSLFSKMELVESYNVLEPDNIETGHFYNKNGSHQTSSSYNCTNNIIPVSEGDVMRLYSKQGSSGSPLSEARYFTAYDATNAAISASGAENTNTYTVPEGVAGVRISWNSNYVDTMITVNNESGSLYSYFDPYYMPTDEFLEDYTEVVSDNKLNPETITDGKYINGISGTMGTSSSYALTDYIKVEPGEVLTATYKDSLNITFRYVASYNSQKGIDRSKGAEDVTTYTVPEGIAFVRISADVRYLYNGTYYTVINANGTRKKWQSHYSGQVKKLAQKNYTSVSNLYNYTLESLPPYILNTLAYRPLGKLSKGYICLVSDDGAAGLATYTVPMLILKEVPVTFAVMSTSECFDGGTNQAAVIDAVQNHNCEIAQHGGITWDQYSEYRLNKFFDEETAFFTSIGLTAYGAVCPAHIINNTIRVVAGGRFGCVRTGYYSAEQYYPGYLNGERSNQFGLTSFNIVDATLSEHQTKIDSANTNHWLYMIHFHENEMDTSARQKLEAVIDYAKQSGITFITMKDIPSIV